MLGWYQDSTCATPKQLAPCCEFLRAAAGATSKHAHHRKSLHHPWMSRAPSSPRCTRRPTLTWETLRGSLELGLDPRLPLPSPEQQADVWRIAQYTDALSAYNILQVPLNNPPHPTPQPKVGHHACAGRPAMPPHYTLNPTLKSPHTQISHDSRGHLGIGFSPSAPLHPASPALPTCPDTRCSRVLHNWHV